MDSLVNCGMDESTFFNPSITMIIIKSVSALSQSPSAAIYTYIHIHTTNIHHCCHTQSLSLCKWDMDVCIHQGDLFLEGSGPVGVSFPVRPPTGQVNNRKPPAKPTATTYGNLPCEISAACNYLKVDYHHHVFTASRLCQTSVGFSA